MVGILEETAAKGLRSGWGATSEEAQLSKPDDWAGFHDRYVNLVRVLLAGAPADYALIDRLQADLLDSLQPPGARWTEMAQEPPEALEMALDLLRTLGQIDASDPALPWNRASILSDLGRNVEAAEDYLRAAQRIAARDSTISDTGDEDWQSAALYHASRQFLLAGQVAAAAHVAASISDEEYRNELTTMLRDRT
jgi:hypothetical protein